MLDIFSFGSVTITILKLNVILQQIGADDLLMFPFRVKSLESSTLPTET
jgi:hypothetical protein